jgi:hypothetical protein
MALSWASAFSSLGQGAAGIGQSITQFAMYNADQKYREKLRQDEINRATGYLKAQGIVLDPETGEARWDQTKLDAIALNEELTNAEIKRALAQTNLWNSQADYYDAQAAAERAGGGGGGIGSGGGRTTWNQVMDQTTLPARLESFEAWKRAVYLSPELGGFSPDMTLEDFQGVSDEEMEEAYWGAKTRWFEATYSGLGMIPGITQSEYEGGTERMLNWMSDVPAFMEATGERPPEEGAAVEEDGGTPSRIGEALGTLWNLGKATAGGIGSLFYNRPGIVGNPVGEGMATVAGDARARMLGNEITRSAVGPATEPSRIGTGNIVGPGPTAPPPVDYSRRVGTGMPEGPGPVMPDRIGTGMPEKGPPMPPGMPFSERGPMPFIHGEYPPVPTMGPAGPVSDPGPPRDVPQPYGMGFVEGEAMAPPYGRENVAPSPFARRFPSPPPTDRGPLPFLHGEYPPVPTMGPAGPVSDPGPPRDVPRPYGMDFTPGGQMGAPFGRGNVAPSEFERRFAQPDQVVDLENLDLFGLPVPYQMRFTPAELGLAITNASRPSYMR